MVVGDLVAGDAAWAAQLMAVRREVYAAYSPVFWRPRRGVTERHARFLERRIQDPNSVALRTGHGFAIALYRGSEGVIDDFGVDDQGSWALDGRELLLAAWARLSVRGVSALRVVTAQADRPKVTMLVAVGLRLVAGWWVKPVEAMEGTVASPGRVDAIGFSGILGPAPPIYDPGGPVLLADHVDVHANPDVIENEAARLGSALVVVPAEPDSDLERALRDRGWTVASQWYLGCPA